MWKKYSPSTRNSLSKDLLNYFRFWVVGEKKNCIRGKTIYNNSKRKHMRQQNAGRGQRKEDSDPDLMMFPVL